MAHGRSALPSRRVVAISFGVLVAACVSFYLLAGYILHERAAKTVDQAPPGAAQLAILNNGSVVFAPNGSIDATLVDWIDDPTPGTRRFDAGGDQFYASSAVPKNVDASELSSFVKILNAYPKANVEIVGYTEKTVPAHSAGEIAVARAKWLYDYLQRSGIDARRLSFRGATDSEIIASRQVHDGQYEARLEVVIEKR
ncbi:OmpA family protein [Sphingomonas sp. PB2P12]